MLHADVRHVAITHRVGFVAGDSHYHLLYIVGGKPASIEETGKRIERSLNWRTHRPFLDVRPRDLVAFPELLDELRRIGLDDAIFPGRQGLKEIVRAGKNVVNTCPT